VLAASGSRASPSKSSDARERGKLPQAASFAVMAWLRPHGRPWAGAFNVVMATAIVSIASHDAGLKAVSLLLLGLAVLAFVPLAALDLGRARHPLVLLHRAGFPGQGFPAFGFVADTCVLGARLVGLGAAMRAVACALLAAGALVWVAILVALARHLAGRARLRRARGEWLLAVVATEGMAILASELTAAGYPGALRQAAVGLWALGIAMCVVLEGLLALRVGRVGLKPRQLTPDWWIVMGAPAIIGLASAEVHPAVGDAAAAAALVAWGVASVTIPVLVAGEAWKARRRGTVPRFTPARWTMVFPLGMYSSMSQAAGHVLGLHWMAALGRWWLVVGVGAWLAVAGGELHHALLRAP